MLQKERPVICCISGNHPAQKIKHCKIRYKIGIMTVGDTSKLFANVVPPTFTSYGQEELSSRGDCKTIVAYLRGQHTLLPPFQASWEWWNAEFQMLAALKKGRAFPISWRVGSWSTLPKKALFCFFLEESLVFWEVLVGRSISIPAASLAKESSVPSGTVHWVEGKDTLETV